MTRALIGILLGSAIAALMFFSLRLAGTRMYRANECTEVYMARALAVETDRASAENITLFQIPLSQVVRGAVSSADIFASARLFMLLIFWLNWMLIASATGERLLSSHWLAALVGAATLAPFWDCGFEIRDDNLLLAGVLFAWSIVRFGPPGALSCFLVGSISAGLQFVSAKSLLYTFPLSLAILAFPRCGCKVSRWKLALAWGTGLLAVFIIIRATFGLAWLWNLQVAGFNLTTFARGSEPHFRLGSVVSRLASQAPLLFTLLVSALISETVGLCRRRKEALTWDGDIPEALLFLVAFATLFINPAPFPQNLLLLFPYAFLLAFRHASFLLNEIRQHQSLLPVVGTLVIFAHLVPFGLATRRHFQATNFRQENLMSLAENATDPVKDLVYDGVGLVPTRRGVHHDWFLHSFNIRKFTMKQDPQVRDMLAARPAAVFIPNYLTDWLPEEDHEFIRERYVSISDDFWVLGKVLPAGGGTFEIYHPGRYRIATMEGSDLAGTYPTGFAGLREPSIEGTVTGKLDGVSLTNHPVELVVGTHRIECAPDCQPTVVWVGPRLNRVGRQGDGNHLRLFYNWY